MNELSRRDLILIGFTSLAVSAIFLLTSFATYGFGFPLDDSWIHQTYARNLALNHEWAFRPGIPSAGSTAPLWSCLLAIGFIIDLSPYLWTYFLGWLCLFCLGWLGEVAVRNMTPPYRPRFPWVGMMISSEWHLVWAALSGMETLLHGLVITAVLALLMAESKRVVTFGLLTGLAVWIRPDGLTLLGPVLLTIILVEKDDPCRVRSISRFLFGFGALWVPYLLFNLLVGGTPMPNTFYAKQAEYAAWQHLPLFTRMGQMSLQLIAGPGLALFPGAVIFSIKSIRERAWGRLAALIWCLAYILLYTSRLPAYQHGRYIMPALPVLFLMGLSGYFSVDLKKSAALSSWRLAAIWKSCLVFLTAGFLYLGARSYGQDVAVIESEMVMTAKWIAANLPQTALIAAHDIGALGYFDTHELIDLAGLISPEVTPFIRDEPRLARFLDEHQADYLVAFPDFYPELTEDLEVSFTTQSEITRGLGKQNMTVYRMKNP